MILKGEIMSEDKENKEENMGDDYGRLPNEWYLQSQKEDRFNIELARREIEQQKNIDRFERSL